MRRYLTILLFIFYQIKDTKVKDTPLWAYGIKSTYVHPYPAQNESKQNPLTQRKVQPPT